MSLIGSQNQRLKQPSRQVIFLALTAYKVEDIVVGPSDRPAVLVFFEQLSVTPGAVQGI